MGKSGVLVHKNSNVSETRKDIGKVTMETLHGGPIGTHQRSFERYHPRPPTVSSSQRLGFATPLKTSIAIISGTGKATDFLFGLHIHRIHPNKSPLKILEKREHGRIQDCPNFFQIPPIISGTGKATNFKFCTHIHRIDGKVAVGILRDYRNFSGHPYIGRIARSSLR